MSWNLKFWRDVDHTERSGEAPVSTTYTDSTAGSGWTLPYHATTAAYNLSTASIPYIPVHPRKEPGMSTLFHVYIVTKKREILIDKTVIADDAEEAKFTAGLGLQLGKIKPKDLTVLCVRIGDVKVDPPAQRVRVMKDDEEE